MSGFILTENVKMICPHGGEVQVKSKNKRVKINGVPVLIQGDDFKIKNCQFQTPAGNPQPCVSVEWLDTAKCILIQGAAVYLDSNCLLTQSAQNIPQGSGIKIKTQMKVKGK